MLLSDFGITNWKDVTVFYPLVEHSKIQHLHVFLGYPVFLAFLFLCVMCNTQKMTKWQTSALGNAFIPYLCYFFLFCFLLIFSLRRWCFLTISDFWTPCSYSSYEKILNHSAFPYLVHASWKFLFQNISFLFQLRI